MHGQNIADIKILTSFTLYKMLLWKLRCDKKNISEKIELYYFSKIFWSKLVSSYVFNTLKLFAFPKYRWFEKFRIFFSPNFSLRTGYLYKVNEVRIFIPAILRQFKRTQCVYNGLSNRLQIKYSQNLIHFIFSWNNFFLRF